MSRSALIVSLALHAGVMGLIARWSPATREGSDAPGVAVSFSPGDSADSWLVEAEPKPTPLQAQPEFNPPTPTPEVLVPVVSALKSASFPLPADIALAQTMPATQPDITPEKRDRVPSREIVHSRSLNGRRGSSARPGDEHSGGSRGLGGVGYVPPQFRLRYKPPYPAAARAQRLEGTTLLFVSVDSAGRVTHANVQRSSGHALLDRAALDAVRSWHFDPARQDGVATAAQVEVPVRFRFVNS